MNTTRLPPCSMWGPQPPLCQEAPFYKFQEEDYFPEVFNQKDRFNSSRDLVEYVCSFYPHNHPTRQMNYDPICPFPYINKGWKLPLDPNNNAGIKFDDCSMLWSDSSQGEREKRENNYYRQTVQSSQLTHWINLNAPRFARRRL